MGAPRNSLGQPLKRLHFCLKGVREMEASRCAQPTTAKLLLSFCSGPHDRAYLAGVTPEPATGARRMQPPVNPKRYPFTRGKTDVLRYSWWRCTLRERRQSCDWRLGGPGGRCHRSLGLANPRHRRGGFDHARSEARTSRLAHWTQSAPSCWTAQDEFTERRTAARIGLSARSCRLPSTESHSPMTARGPE